LLFDNRFTNDVIPAKAGIQSPTPQSLPRIPAFAGMTMPGDFLYD
jgi:hypothetical protein